MLHRGRITAHLLRKQHAVIIPTVGAYAYAWNPAAVGSCLYVDLSAYTSISAEGVVTITLDPSFSGGDGEELELCFIGGVNKPVRVDLSSWTDLAAPPSYASICAPGGGGSEEVIVLRKGHSAATWRVVDRYGADGSPSGYDNLVALSDMVPLAGGFDHLTLNAVLLCGMSAAVAAIGGVSFVGGVSVESGSYSWRIYRGTGASDWTPATIPVTTNRVITGILMASASVGYATGKTVGSTAATDYILGTTDGGLNWTTLGTHTSNTGYDGIRRAYYNGGWHLLAYREGTDELSVSDDGGVTWVDETLPSSSHRVYEISSPASGSGQFAAAGDDGSGYGRLWLRGTEAAGSGVWTAIISDAAATTTLRGVCNGMAVGDSGKVWVTNDGWATALQRPVLNLSSSPVYRIDCVEAISNIFCVVYRPTYEGPRMMAYSPDYGATFYGNNKASFYGRGAGTSFKLGFLDGYRRLAVFGGIGATSVSRCVGIRALGSIR